MILTAKSCDLIRSLSVYFQMRETIFVAVVHCESACGILKLFATRFQLAKKKETMHIFWEPHTSIRILSFEFSRSKLHQDQISFLCYAILTMEMFLVFVFSFQMGAHYLDLKFGRFVQ